MLLGIYKKVQKIRITLANFLQNVGKESHFVIHFVPNSPKFVKSAF